MEIGLLHYNWFHLKCSVEVVQKPANHRGKLGGRRFKDEEACSKAEHATGGGSSRTRRERDQNHKRLKNSTAPCNCAKLSP